MLGVRKIAHLSLHLAGAHAEFNVKTDDLPWAGSTELEG